MSITEPSVAERQLRSAAESIHHVTLALASMGDIYMAIFRFLLLNNNTEEQAETLAFDLSMQSGTDVSTGAVRMFRDYSTDAEYAQRIDRHLPEVSA